MLLFVLIGILLAGSIFVCIKADAWYNDGLLFTSILTGVTSLVILIVLICNVPWKKEVELDKARYNELVIKVSQVSNLDPEFLPVVLQKDIINEITNMNMYIEKNRIYHDSWWLGWLYSEEIGNLQKINYIPEGS